MNTTKYVKRAWALHTRNYSVSVIAIFLALFTSLVLSSYSHALTTTPTTMNFQGRLTDASGSIMPNGLYNMQFKLFTVSTGGSNVWNETRETTNRVQVTNGLFSTKLGEVTPIPASLFASGSLYFEITLPTPATSTCNTAACASWESPMTPRHGLSTSAYAFNSDTLDGLDSTAFAAATGSANYIQNTGSPQTADFNITGTGTAALLQAATIDRANAGTLTIGGTNATSITLADNLTVATGMSITFASGTGTFDQSASTGTFATGTGAVSLNGNTTIANGMNLNLVGGAIQTQGVTRLSNEGTLANIAGYLQTAGDFTIQGMANISTANNSITLGSSTGNNWVKRYSGLGGSSTAWQSITSSSDGTKLAATDNGGYIYTSTDSGATWTERTASGSRNWYSITSSSDGTKLAAVEQYGYIYTSTDSGATWTEATASGSRNWYSITSSSDGTKLAATDNGGYIYTSTDSGATWTERTASGSRNWSSITSSSDGTKLASVENGGYIYTSTDSGATWTEATASGSRYWSSITSSSDGTKLAAAQADGYIYTSTDSGATWTEQTASGSRYWISITSSSDGTKLASVENGGYIYTSTDSGATWTEATASGSRNWYSITSSSDGTKLAAGDRNGYIYTSTDSGATWTEATASGSRYWSSITSSSDGTKLAAVDGDYGYIYTSTDSGATWTEATASGSRYWSSITSSSDGTKLAAVEQYGYIYTSTDSGATWTERTASGSRNWYSITSSSDGTKLAAGDRNGYIYTSTDSGATWTEATASGSRYWSSITSSSDGTKLAAVDGDYGYIYTSTDSGATWTEATASGSRWWSSITSSSDGTKLAATDNGGYIYTSTDSGATWTERTASGSRNWYSITSSSDGTKLAAVEQYGYIYTSTDSGATWTEATASGSRNWYSITSSSDGTKLASVENGGSIYTYGSPVTTINLQGAVTAASLSVAQSISTANITVSGSLTLTGGNTASRPASPTEGMVYFDTTTKQILTYANGKWQADRSDAVLVAASNSSAADKAAADYVADGNTGAANDGDQVQINSALTAGSGKKVVLLAGTYTADATILIPNNTMLSGVGNGTVVQYGVDVSDNLIENSDVTTGKGITIRDMTLDGRSDINTTGNISGARLNHLTASTFEGVYVKRFKAYGITLDSISTNNKILNNTFDTNNVGLFLYTGSDQNIIANNHFISNVISVHAAFNYRNVISNNTISGGGDGIIVETAPYSFIGGNIIENLTGFGIYEFSSTYNTISSNTISNTGVYGINIEDSNDSNIVSNAVWASGGATTNNGLYIYNSTNNNISDNVIYDTDCSTNCYAIFIDAPSASNSLSNNKFNATSGTAVISDASTTTRYLGQTKVEGGLDPTFKQAASTTAFQIQNASSAALLTADSNSTNNRIQIGSSTTDATAIFFMLDKFNNGTDPTGTDGAMYYNTNTSKFRCYQGAWMDCIGANMALSNLASVAINTSLISDTTNTDDLGSSGITWRSGYFGTSLNTPAIRPLADSATALLIQNAAGSTTILTVNSSANSVIIGSTSNGVIMSGTGVSLVGTARPDVKVTLAPEFQGATFSGDGSNNNGSLSSDFCSGSSRQNINTAVCAATVTHNYYAWTTTQASAQDYDIYVRYQMPSDYDAGTMTNLQIWGWGTNTTNEQVTIALISDGSATPCSTSGNAVTGATTWAQATTASPLGSCTPAADETVTFKIHVQAGQNNVARAGEINFSYKKKY